MKCLLFFFSSIQKQHEDMTKSAYHHHDHLIVFVEFTNKNTLFRRRMSIVRACASNATSYGLKMHILLYTINSIIILTLIRNFKEHFIL